jgi:hypothetical protein
MNQISLKEYNVRNSAQDMQDILKIWVNREEKSWYRDEYPLKRITKVDRVEFPQWVKHLVKGSLGVLEELKP